MNQLVGWKILLCGCALMLVGYAIARQIQLENSGDSPASTSAVIVLLIPIGMGALLAFLGATRLALTAKPAYLLPSGLFLDIAVKLVPRTTLVPPQISAADSSLPFLLPLYALHIVGLIFVSIGFLRLLIRVGQKRKTHSEGSSDEARKA